MVVGSYIVCVMSIIISRRAHNKKEMRLLASLRPIDYLTTRPLYQLRPELVPILNRAQVTVVGQHARDHLDFQADLRFAGVNVGQLRGDERAFGEFDERA